MRRLIILCCWLPPDTSSLDIELKNRNNSLVEGYSLHWYEIRQIIGQGGFGITYLAKDNNLHRQVAIKEFMPEDFATRESDSTVHPKNGEYKKLYDWGLQRFIDEARTLAKFNHPNIVRVLSVFEENNTAYMIMEYEQGRDLSSIYKEPARLSEEELLGIFIPVMDGLSLVHNAGFIHRDIKPANIYIRDNNTPLLLDFGSARQSIGDKTKTLTSLVTFGYAPFEQYNEGSGKQGPWTDIYSLGASLYTAVTGNKPADALHRGGGFIDKGEDTYEPASIVARGEYSDNFLLAIDRALMFKIEDRPADILQCADMLLGKIQAPELPDFMKGSSSERKAKLAANPSAINGSGNELNRFAGQEPGRSPATISELSSGIGTGVELPKISTRESMQGLVNARVVSNGRSNETVAKNKTPPQVSPGGLSDVAQGNISESEYRQMKKGIKRDGPTRHGPVKPQLIGARSGKSRLRILLLMMGVAGLAAAGWYFYQLPVAQDASEVLQLEQQKQKELHKQRLRQAEQAKVRKAKAKQREDRRQKKKRIDRLIAAAERAFSNGDYVKPTEKSAYTYYRQILKLQAGHTAAVDGLKNTEKELLNLARSAYFDKHYQQSLNYLQQLEIVNPDSSTAGVLLNRIKTEQKQKSQISAWVVEAKKHIKNKRLTKPSGNNAYEVYQKILIQQPQNAYALEGVENIRQHYIALFKKHISAMQLKKAERDILTMKKIFVSVADIKKMQKALKLSQRKQRAIAQANKKSVPVKQVEKKLNIEHASQKVSQFKTALQSGNRRELKQISQYMAGREKFVNDLLEQYKKINVRISNFKLIANENKAHAQIVMYDLVDIKGRNVSPGGWGQFEIILSYNSRNQLKVIW